tara:strand:+ start:63 stop:626 length:564 start_codon:yes stop_codon:yes gene_type:complete
MKHIKETQVNPRGCKVKRCTTCLVDIVYPDNINPSNFRNHTYICRTCDLKKEYQKEKKRRKNKKVGDKQHLTDMLDGCRARSRKNNILFSLKIKDLRELITDTCPILGIKYEINKKNKQWGKGKGKNNWQTSPSIDRIVPNKGYTKENVIIVSLMANSIKNQATPKQILKVGEFYKELYKEKGIVNG